MHNRFLFLTLFLLTILGASTGVTLADTAPTPSCPAVTSSDAAVPALVAPGTPAPILAASTCTLRCPSDKKITCTSRSGDCQFVAGGSGDFIICDGVATACPLPAP
jgi:hypothetical protein